MEKEMPGRNGQAKPVSRNTGAEARGPESHRFGSAG